MVAAGKLASSWASVKSRIIQFPSHDLFLMPLPVLEEPGNPVGKDIVFLLLGLGEENYYLWGFFHNVKYSIVLNSYCLPPQPGDTWLEVHWEGQASASPLNILVAILYL